MISKQLAQLFESFSTTPPQRSWQEYEGPRFSTNTITISVGSFYERLRYAVDYQEEHVLRRAAIERFIRRIILFSTFQDAGRSILEELVRARYIENNSVPERFADDIQAIMERYRKLESAAIEEGEIVWSYAAIEIEQLLFPSDINERTFMAAFQTVVSYLRPKEEGYISESAFNLRVYIACRRVFLRESHAMLNFSLFRMMVPEWRTPQSLDASAIAAIGARFGGLQEEIQSLMNDPLHWRIAGRLKNERIYFSLLNEIVRRFGKEAEAVLGDFQRLSEVVGSELEKTYEVHKEKVKRSGTRAIIYVLITKIIVGLAIEYPYEVFILRDVNYTALAINILLVPILLFFMTKTVRYPDKHNTEAIVRNLHSFVEGEQKNKTYVSVAPKTYVQRLGHLFFATTFFTLSFGVIIYVLEYFAFNPASIALFLLFLCIVTYMGLHIRERSREWTLEREDDSFFSLMWFLLVLPITRTGRWISEQLSSVNVFVFFMDFILETPFKLLLGSFDSFVSYVKETKRDGV